MSCLLVLRGPQPVTRTSRSPVFGHFFWFLFLTVFWSQMVAPREPKIAQNPQKSCSRGLPESTLQKVTKNDAIWVPSRPQNIGFRNWGYQKSRNSRSPKMSSKLHPNAYNFGCFWHHISQKVASGRVPENALKNEPKKYQKRS